MSKIGAEISIEQIDDWFKIGKPAPKIKTIARSSTRGQGLVHADPCAVPQKPRAEKQPFIPPYKRHSRLNNPNQTAYARHYQMQEVEQLTSQSDLPGQSMRDTRSLGGMESLETDSIATAATSQVLLPEGMTAEEAVEVYRNYYVTSHKYDPRLAITQYKDEILATVESNQVTVIQGPTGSGKTTQVPQYILDHYAHEPRYCNIIVTQPRRIAAISIARRVCHERGWQLGGICGYQIGMERAASEESRLVYCTTGVLLQKLISAKSMQQYTHVILDEVHERDKDSDFCLLIVRKLLRTNSRDVKVILMSATFDTDMFAQYFSLPVRGMLEPAPVFSCEGRTYTVSEYYIDDLKLLGPIADVDPNKPSMPKESLEIAQRLIMEFDRLEIKEQGEGKLGTGFADKRGSVLVFLPGLAEISDMDEVLSKVLIKHQLWLLPLHSSITGEEQARVFDTPASPQRKVILSTNIAESSITVPDIKYVIDFCLTKNMVSDPETNYSCLQTAWASRSNCTQRKGRAGRVSDGRVYRMVPRWFYQDHIPDYGIPEMQRCPLESLVLHVKMLDLGEPKAILGLALSPPNLDDLEKTILFLKEVGALAILHKEAVNPHDGELTFLGRVLASLPVDIRVGKLMLLGHVFGLLEECIIIGAAMSLKSFFATPFKAHLEAYKFKLGWASESLSDCAAILDAYRVWEGKTNLQVFRYGGQSEVQWGRKHFIQIRRIKEVFELVKDLKQRLKQFNIQCGRDQQEDRSSPQDQLLLKLVLCGAFYPNYFVRVRNDEKEAMRAMSGKNPCTTVVVKGLPANQGTLYKSAVESLFKAVHNNPVVHFEETRALIEFPRDEKDCNSHTILKSVYLAIKMRQLRIPLEIQLLDAEQVHEKMKKLNQQMESKAVRRLRTNRIKAVSEGVTVHPKNQGPKPVALPTPEKLTEPIWVTEVLNCGHFWAYYNKTETWRDLHRLQQHIQQFVRDSKPLMPAKLVIGQYCLAPFLDGHSTEYYRAKIQRCEIETPDDLRLQQCVCMHVTVFFLDYGNTARISLLCDEITKNKVDGDDLYELDLALMEVEAQAFECELSHIKPSPVKCPNGRWTPQARMAFSGMVAEKSSLIAKVYSIVHGVVRMELINTEGIDSRGRRVELNINEQLIAINYAEHTEESWTSNQNNLQREEEAMAKNARVVPGGSEDWLEMPSLEMEGISPSSNLRRRAGKVPLNGPSSPYEMRFAAMTNVGRLREAKIDRNSVNSVALDDGLQDPHDRMMVAGFVGLNPSGNVMLVRDTTIMPDIRGLPAMVSILFAPCMELRVDRDRKRYTGALCGLGWCAETGGPALPDHDMEIVFDTAFDLEDLVKINSVRLAINIAIGIEETMAQWGYDAVRKIQRNAREKILGLIQRNRESVTPVFPVRPYQWNQLDPTCILPTSEEMSDSHGLYTLHSGVTLQNDEEFIDPEEERVYDLKMKRLHIEWLKSVVESYTGSRTSSSKTNASRQSANQPTKEKVQFPVLCELCNNISHTLQQLKIHLATLYHRQEEARILLATM